MINKHSLLILMCVGLIVQMSYADDLDTPGEILDLEDISELEDIDDVKELRELEDYDYIHDVNRQIDQAIVGDTAVLLEEGELELTFGISFEDEGDVETVEQFIQIEYGLTDWLEISFEVPYLFINPDEGRDVDGLGDVTLAVSIAVLAEYPFLVSASLDTTIPTGNEDRSEDLGEGTDVWEPSISIDVALENEAELVFDLSGEFGHDISAFSYEMTFACPFGDVVPSIGIEGGFDGGEQDVSVVPGIGFPIAEDVEVGIEVPVGLNDETSDWKIDFELTFEF